MREPASNFAAIAFAAGFSLVCFAPQIFHDGDTWWHLAAGNWMLAHRAVPTRDFFSYTFAGQPWTAHEWLSEIAMALSYWAAGWSGLHILFGLAFGTACAVTGYTLRRRLDFVPALLVAVLGLSCIAGSLLARPHLLALPILAIWTAVLIEARENDTAPPLWLAPVMLLWANLHGSFAFGLALAAALGAEAVAASDDRVKTLRQWGLLFVTSLIAALITPQGLEGLLFPLKLLAMPGLAGIGEWGPSDVTHPSPFLITLLAMIFVLAQGKVRLPWPRAALIAVLSYLALSHVRHVVLFGIAAPLLAAPAMGAAWPVKADAGKSGLAVGAMTLAALLLLTRLVFPATRGEDRVTPAAALAAVPESLRQQPVLNAYDYGGYLIFEGVKVFIDGRTDMYSTDFLSDDDRLNAGDGSAIAAALSRYHIAWTILPAGSPSALALDRMPGWHRLHADANAVVHIRDQPPPPG